MEFKRVKNVDLEVLLFTYHLALLVWDSKSALHVDLNCTDFFYTV